MMGYMVKISCLLSLILVADPVLDDVVPLDNRLHLLEVQLQTVLDQLLLQLFVLFDLHLQQVGRVDDSRSLQRVLSGLLPKEYLLEDGLACLADPPI